jgi:chorismate mutase/prephenate dehydratase
MKNIEEVRGEIREADRQMAAIFEKRMRAVREIAAYKKEHGLQIENKEQERKVLEANASFIEDEMIRQYYLTIMKDVIEVSKMYQERLIPFLQ